MVEGESGRPFFLPFARAGMMVRPMLSRLLLAIALLFTAVPAAAQDDTLQGSWALVADETVIFRFDLQPEAGTEWSGTWLRPDSFGSNGEVFVQVKGPVERVEAMGGNDFAGLVEVSFHDPRPDAVPDIFRFRQTGPDTAEMTYVGTDLAPYPMQRVTRNTPLGPWEADKVYRRPVSSEGAAMVGGRPGQELPGGAGDLDDTRVENEPAPDSGDAQRIGNDFLDGL